MKFEGEFKDGCVEGYGKSVRQLEKTVHQDVNIVSLRLVIVSCVCASRAIDVPRWSSWCPTKRGLVSKPQAAEEREVSGRGAACTGLRLQRSQSGTLTVTALEETRSQFQRLPGRPQGCVLVYFPPALLLVSFSLFSLSLLFIY